MRAIHLAIAAVIAMALAVVPVAAGFAKAPAAKVELGMSLPDDACLGCDAHHLPGANLCNLDCCSAAILVDVPMRRGLQSSADACTVVAVPSPFSRTPDPPPPRC